MPHHFPTVAYISRNSLGGNICFYSFPFKILIHFVVKKKSNISSFLGSEFVPNYFSSKSPTPNVFPTPISINVDEAFQQELQKEQMQQELEKEEIRRKIFVDEMTLARR